MEELHRIYQLILQLFLKNMQGLGIEVKDIDYGVLSHAHYDHANGIPAFFENNDKAG